MTCARLVWCAASEVSRERRLIGNSTLPYNLKLRSESHFA